MFENNAIQMCDYFGNFIGEHVLTSRVRVRRKVVDTTYLEVSLPPTGFQLTTVRIKRPASTPVGSSLHSVC